MSIVRTEPVPMTSRWRMSSRPKCWAVRSMSCRRRRAACSASSAN
jgi:hypothetical protein